MGGEGFEEFCWRHERGEVGEDVGTEGEKARGGWGNWAKNGMKVGGTYLYLLKV